MTNSRAQWLTVLRLVPRLWEESAWTDDERSIVAEHFAYLQDLCEKGQVLVVGRTHVQFKDAMGLCIFLADDEQAARHLMESDPVVRKGVMTGEVFPYRVALASPVLMDLV